MGTEEFEEALKSTEVKLARLRSLYEQWFAGIERIEPGVARKDLERMIEILKREQPRNTALRFRLQQLVARYGTYGLYWTRIGKQIEDGTYRRDLQRLKARQTREQTKAEAFELDVDVESDAGVETDLDFDAFGDSDLDAILGALTSAPPPAAKPAAPKSFSKPMPTPPSPETKTAQTRTTPLPPKPATEGTHASVRPGAAAKPPLPPAPPSPALSKPTDAKIPPPPRIGLGARGPAVPPPVAAPASGPQPLARIQKPAVPVTGGVREAAGAHSRSAPPETRNQPMPAPQAARPPASAGPAAGDEMRTLYDRYLDARKKNNERVDNVKYETLASSVEKMMPKLREKHAGKQIEFEVVLQDGKVGLKPKVRG
jgi:hypothetical protein